MSDYKNNLNFDDTSNIEDPKEFFKHMNSSLGNSLSQLYEPKHKVKGRSKELHQLDIQMNRPITPVTMLLGLAGAGKTAIVESWKKIQHEKGKKVVLLSLELGAMSADGHTMLQHRMESLMPKLKEYQNLLRKTNPETDVVLFIDEVHMIISIFGKGSKIGGDLLKKPLARSYVKVIAATTRSEYNSYIANDAPLARRFKNIQINELPENIIKEILYDWLKVYAPEYKDIPEETLDKTIRANQLYRPEFAEPAKSIDILESAVSTCRIDGGHIDNALVNDIFKEQFNIKLDFSANYKHIRNTILKRVKGQPMALYTVDRAIKRLVFSKNDSNKPRATMFFIGSSGVGKTELAKGLAEGMYDNENNVLFFKMNRYTTEDTLPLFNKNLGEDVRHNQDTVILLDELEKAHDFIIKALLSILEEGIVEYTVEGSDGAPITHEVSLRNTIVIGTSNAAADLFKEAHRFSKQRKSIKQNNMDEFTSTLKQEYEDMENDIHESLLQEPKFSPEFLGRFSHIIPFYALHESTLLYIAEKSIIKTLKYLNSLPENFDIKINQKEDWSHMDYDYVATSIAMYIVFELANTQDSNSGGARAIQRYIDNNLFTEIIETILEYPEEKRFFIKTNGKCGFETKAYGKGEGDIIVQPANTKKPSLLTQK